jgi:hypothetical protein
MPVDPLDQKRPDPFARRAAEQRAADARKSASSNAPPVTTVTTTTAKPAPPGNPFRVRSSDPRLLLGPSF